MMRDRRLGDFEFGRQVTDGNPTTAALAHDLLTSFIGNRFGEKDRTGFHRKAPLNSARRNSWVPMGPVNSNEIGSPFEFTFKVNFKNAQHKRSLEINSAILVINSV